jgi:hypothetical protein
MAKTAKNIDEYIAGFEGAVQKTFCGVCGKGTLQFPLDKPIPWGNRKSRPAIHSPG